MVEDKVIGFISEKFSKEALKNAIYRFRKFTKEQLIEIS